MPLELWVALCSPISMQVSASDSMYIVSTTKLLCLCKYGFVNQCDDWWFVLKPVLWNFNLVVSHIYVMWLASYISFTILFLNISTI